MVKKDLPGGSGSGSGGGVTCQIGTNTTIVDSEETCAQLGGTVVPPKKSTPICGGCGAAIGEAAVQLGLTGDNINGPWRSFLELAAKSSKDGKALLESFANADKHITESIRNNPSALGDVMMSLVGGAEFAKLIMEKPGGPFDALKLPKVTKTAFKRSIKALRKGSDKKEFRKILDFMELELERWSRKTVAEMRGRFLKTGLE